MDLGSAIIVDEQIRPACAAGAVFAPEFLFERIVRPTDPGSPPTQASDIWSLACTIYELMFGTRLFHLTNRNSLLGMMAELCGEVSPEWKEYWDTKRSFAICLCRMQLLGLNGITSWNALRRDLRGNTRRLM